MRGEILPVVDDPSLAGQLHWTGVKLCGWLRDTKGFEISYRALIRYLHQQDYARRIPGPMSEPPGRDAWLKQREDCAMRLTTLLEDPRNNVFFGDVVGL